MYPFAVRQDGSKLHISSRDCHARHRPDRRLPFRTSWHLSAERYNSGDDKAFSPLRLPRPVATLWL